MTILLRLPHLRGNGTKNKSVYWGLLSNKGIVGYPFLQVSCINWQLVIA